MAPTSVGVSRRSGVHWGEWGHFRGEKSFADTFHCCLQTRASPRPWAAGLFATASTLSPLRPGIVDHFSRPLRPYGGFYFSAHKPFPGGTCSFCSLLVVTCTDDFSSLPNAARYFCLENVHTLVLVDAQVLASSRHHCPGLWVSSRSTRSVMSVYIID